MEKRAILAAVLMAAVFIVYQTFFLPVEPPAPQKAPAQTAAPAPTPQPAPAPAPAPLVTPPPRGAPPGPRPPQRLTTVDAPLYRAVVSSEGGKLQELTLKYRGEKPMVIVGDLGPAGLLVAPGSSAPAAPVPMTMGAESVSVKPGRAESLALTGEADGLHIRQTLRFEPESYVIAVGIRIENASAAPRKVTVELPWASRISWTGVPEKFPGQHPIEVVWSAGGAVDRAPHWMNPALEGLVEHPPKLDREGNWIAIGGVWYLAALIPKTAGFQLVTSVEKPEEAKDGRKVSPGRVMVGVRATPEIAPGKAWEGEVAIFAGPKEYRLLESLGIEETINFGGFPIPWYWGGLPMRWFGVPMVAQVPIFYALYLALSVSVELQNAAFLCFGRLFGVDLWICDLAAHDPTYVLPVLMGITMFIQQKLTPTTGDPRQAKMMLFMPFVFTFMFLNLPSGLVLYWTVSNVLQILQQKLMDRPARTRATREAKDASRA